MFECLEPVSNDKLLERIHRLIIPSDDLYNWIDFVNEAREFAYDNTDVVIIDFNTLKFMLPRNITMLACLLEFINENYKVVYKFVNGKEILRDHLINIKFTEYWNLGFERDKYTSSDNDTTLCLWQISSNMIDNYGIQAREYYSRRYFQKLDLIPFSAILVEVFNNIFNHSNSSIRGYVLTQYFPKTKKMSISVCDFGEGIPTSINKYNEIKGQVLFRPDSFAILKVLEKGISARSIPRNAGLGLYTVLDFVNNTNGTLTILSNNGYYKMKSSYNPVTRDLNTKFGGTLINIDIDTNYFELVNDEDLVYEF